MTDINPTVPPILYSTNLGPLTTSTSLPADCLNNMYDFHTYGLGYPWTYETQGCAISTCCPSNNFYTVGWGWFSSYYSPGVCPLQYKSCAPPATGLSTGSGETIIFCCPDAYDCPATSEDGIRYWACQSLLSTSTPVTVLNGIYDQSFLSTRQFSLDASLGASYQVAYPIQIRFKQSQLTTTGSEVFIGDFTATTESMTAAATTKGTMTGSPASSTAQGSSNPVGSHDTGGLSTGAKAGIGVGAAVGALLIIALPAWLFVLRRRHNKLRAQMDRNSSASATAEYAQHGDGKHHGQFNHGQSPYIAPKAELEARTIGTYQSRRSELP